MKFVMNANFVFEAENIDDAIAKLSAYFECIGTSKEFTLSEDGKIDIRPVEENKEIV